MVDNKAVSGSTHNPYPDLDDNKDGTISKPQDDLTENVTPSIMEHTKEVWYKNRIDFILNKSQ